MKIPAILCSAAVVMIASPAFAQSAPAKPLSEGQLLKTLDSFGTGDPLTKAPLSIGDLAQAKPAEKKAPEKEGEKKMAGATEITAREASFDQKTRQAVFAVDVVVKNPEFNINCDKLTAFLHNEVVKAAPGAGAKPATPATPKPATPPPAAGEKKKDTGGLEKAIAEGSVVITQEKVDAEGNVSRNIGRSKRAVYEAGSGDVTLTGRPEVQQGINTIVATDENTVIILNREGRMKVTGPHKTVIKDAPENPTPNGR